MQTVHPCRAFWVGLFGICLAGALGAEERTQSFDKDPAWDSHNNRAAAEPRTIRQDFGYSPTAHAGGGAGEMGGFISPAAEPAYYARVIPAKTFADALTAKGSLASTGREFHALIAFFNADTLNEWRTPNTIALRISGRGDVFYAWVEYATSRWRAGGDDPRSFPTERDPETGRDRLKGFPSGRVTHQWSLRYDPKANDGGGAVTATIDDQTAVCHLAKGHKADGAVFNRFGLLNVMKSADQGGEVWLDDVTVNGEMEDFTEDPVWDRFQNRRTYQTENIRPRFDFGYSPTRHAGGRGRGELGGLVFRGDCRFPEKMAYYGDRLGRLTLEKPLKASGKVSLRRGVTDSTALIGFFHSTDSMAVNPSQDSGVPRNFLGVSVDGPSREGFYFAPLYRVDGDARSGPLSNAPPYIYPDGAAHDWSLEYSPTAAGGGGRITLALDGRSVSLDLGPGHKKADAHFDRFGIITSWIDGNSQSIYFDDLAYTSTQE